MTRQASGPSSLATSIPVQDMQNGRRPRPDASPQHVSPTISAATSTATSRSQSSPLRAANTVPSSNKPSAKDTNLAHQAAVHRVNVRQALSANSRASGPSQPVLVNPAPKSKHMKDADAATSSPTLLATPVLPSPHEFSFEEILDSIGPDAHAAIDAIAEICGRSKLSLADQHSSHRPPQGEVEALPTARTEEIIPEEIGNGQQARSMAWRLTGSRNQDDILANATAATSAVTSHMHTPDTSTDVRHSERSAVLAPQIIAWLRGSEPAEPATTRSTARTSLHRLLDESEGVRT